MPPQSVSTPRHHPYPQKPNGHASQHARRPQLRWLRFLLHRPTKMPPTQSTALKTQRPMSLPTSIVCWARRPTPTTSPDTHEEPWVCTECWVVERLSSELRLARGGCAASLAPQSPAAAVLSPTPASAAAAAPDSVTRGLCPPEAPPPAVLQRLAPACAWVGV